jgi:hypothetical protein
MVNRLIDETEKKAFRARLLGGRQRQMLSGVRNCSKLQKQQGGLE